MASIKPFRALRPNPLYATSLIQTSPQVQSVAGDSHYADGLPVLKIALEIGARHRPETTEGQAKAYEDIRHTLNELIKQGLLQSGDKPAMYVYEVTHKTYRQTAIWALTGLEDYTNGTIKTHELTFADSVRRIKNYRKNTRLEGSPILMTYTPSVTVNRIIAETMAAGHNKISISNHEAAHVLWRIEDEATLKELVAAFARVKTVYLADGHHRLESAYRLAHEQRENREPVFNTISALYMATDQLRIQEFDRVVFPDPAPGKEDLLNRIRERFELTRADAPVQPRDFNRIGMYAFGEWFELTPRNIPIGNFASRLDASILQEQLLAPVFGIVDPVNDKRLKCIGGAGALSEIRGLINGCPDAVAFTLCPLSIDQLIHVADAGEILPPKSTWIDPKVPYGLLLYQH
ncbi:DUF1015 family protein [Mucilaginibacter ginsenosidivorans]|uniref:DUF1015 domain-containing protein n=1 Tax=Mucilaginibacter ginsenosidivorans TaxID=398053 RepID=A0A5B8UW67_9SPHI|nr:DUF1015 family protein [Mucilaginibacter ginsenosidivorans]QEC63370.1 DUF1015 domain-containing protein [Mucilaginibacter ginsenosidivorans]